MGDKPHSAYRLVIATLRNRIAKRFPACLLMVFALLITTTVLNKSVGQTKAPLSQAFPRGNWSVSSHPYLGADSESAPVIVTSVTSEAKKGIAVTKVGLDNQSQANVAAIKLTWQLSSEQNAGKVLLQGQTPYITRDGGLPAGSSLVLRFPVVAFAKIYQPLVRNAALDGNFRIDILVSEILFEDGSKWAKSDSSQAGLIKAAHHASRPAIQGTCGRQACETRTSPAGNVFYACRASDSNERCSVSDDGFSCTNISCTQPRPTGEYEGYEMILP